MINSPKTQAILKLHQKSIKRTVLSLSKERIDNLVACLEWKEGWKEAKRRADNAQVTSSKEGLRQSHAEDNNKNFKCPKLVRETWRPKKRKTHRGPQFYQQDKAKEKLGKDDK